MVYIYPYNLSAIVPHLLAVIMSLMIGDTRGSSCGAMTVAVAGDNQASLTTKTIDKFKSSCRKAINTCSIETRRRSTFQKIPFLEPLVIPFKLDFALRASLDAIIELEEEEKYQIEITLGGWYNEKSTLRRMQEEGTVALGDDFSEVGIIDADEFRPFWIQLQDDVLKVGKGGQDVAFLTGDVANYTQPNMSIKSKSAGSWVFSQSCV